MLPEPNYGMFINDPFVLSSLLVLFSILEDVQRSIALLSIDLQTQKDEVLKVKIAKPATAGTFYFVNGKLVAQPSSESSECI